MVSARRSLPLAALLPQYHSLNMIVRDGQWNALIVSDLLEEVCAAYPQVEQSGGR